MSIYTRAEQLVNACCKCGVIDTQKLENAIEAALREQIEACAKVADDILCEYDCGEEIAAAIRQLKVTP